MLCPTYLPIDQFIADWRSGLGDSGRHAHGNARYRLILRFISDFERALGFMPTIREIMAVFRTTSTSSVLFALKRLASADYIDLYSGVARGMTITDKGRECVASGAVPVTSGRALAEAERAAGMKVTYVPADMSRVPHRRAIAAA